MPNTFNADGSDDGSYQYASANDVKPKVGYFVVDMKANKDISGPHKSVSDAIRTSPAYSGSNPSGGHQVVKRIIEGKG